MEIQNLPHLQPYITLASNAKFKQISEILGSKVFSFNQDRQLYLTFDQYNRLQGKKLFNKIKQMRMIRVSLTFNQRENIIKEISLTSFPLLTNLQIAGNDIQSIESLQHVYAPNLKHLDISNNFVSQVFTFRKTNFPNLNLLLLQSNKILSIEQLQKSNFPQIKQIDITNNSSNNKSFTFQKLIVSNFNKLQIFNLEYSKINKPLWDMLYPRFQNFGS